MDQQMISMITLQVPYIKEELYGSAMSEYIDQIIRQVENFDSQPERLNFIRNQLAFKRLFSVIVTNMDAIKLLNDSVGGVTVVVKEDFSEIDSTLPMGEVTLMGDQAITYVRSRYGIGDQLNLSRMERQKEYMYGFVEALSEKKDSATFATTTFEAVSPYMVTDCSSVVFNNLLQRFGDYPIVEIVSPEGENVMADYYQFYVDEDKLDALILRLFYVEK